MNTLSKSDFKELIEHTGLCVSTFMPTHRAGPETRQDPIRLKNMLARAEEGLAEAGLRSSEVEEFVEPVQGLLEDNLFWQYQTDGLAIFLSQGLFRSYCLPLEFQELVVVSDRFHVKPLLPLFIADGRFYVLALSQNEIRLLQGTRYSSREIELEGVPRNLAEALRFDDPEKQLQFHTGTPARKGKRPAMFHGHGVGTDDSKVNLFRYFRYVDRGLHDILRDEEAPLVVASVDYLLPIYREANTYPHLMEEGVEGNPEGLSAEELHGRAWSVVEAYFEKAQRDAVTLYRQFAGTRRTSRDIKEIAPAAYHGRVELLFVALGLQQWGAFNPDKSAVRLHQEPEPGDEDLLDMAAVQTFLKGGTVYAVEPDEVPDGGPSAALFRY